jgi:hypothetical protein
MKLWKSHKHALWAKCTDSFNIKIRSINCATRQMWARCILALALNDSNSSRRRVLVARGTPGYAPPPPPPFIVVLEKWHRLMGSSHASVAPPPPICRLGRPSKQNLLATSPNRVMHTLREIATSLHVPAVKGQVNLWLYFHGNTLS